MAENILEAKILLRYGTYSQWMNNDDILREGEAAIATFPYNNTLYPTGDYPEKTPPAVGIKIGNGKKTFRDLPWIQAIAADVYTWAKESNKPSYTAEEIQGLDNYINSHTSGGGGSGSGSVTTRIYELTEGTGANENKYYLRYKEDSPEGYWIIDTSHYIDLNNYERVYEWIGEFNLSYDSLTNKTEEHIQYDLSQLSSQDREELRTFVTSVSQTNGQISITKKELEFDDILGTLDVSRGGTGKTSFNEDEVLVGNGNEGIKTVKIAEEVAANNYLVPNYLVKQYVDSSVKELEKTMHFIGEATVSINPNSNVNPQIIGYNFSNAKPGDVIIANNNQEFIWNGSVWHILGDEASYAVKGRIVNADIAENAAIAQSKINGLESALNQKVNKEENKTLISLDEKAKLENIEDEAQVNVIEHIVLNETEIPITGEKTVILNIPVLTAEQLEKIEAAEPNTIDNIFVNGVLQTPTKIQNLDKSVDIQFIPFTSEEKTKLGTILANAEPNRIDYVFVNNEPINPTEINGLKKSIAINFYPFTEIEHNKLADIEEEAEVNTIKVIQVNGREIAPNENRIVNINNIIEHIFVNGQEKSLETVDDKANSINITFIPFTSEEKTKLSGIQTGAQVNVIEHLQLNGRDLANEEKTIDLTPFANKIEKIQINGIEQSPNAQKIVNLEIDPYNIIESISVDGQNISPDENKNVNLDLNYVKGAVVPNGNTTENVEIISKQLQLARIAKTGNIEDLIQTNNTYIILDCGTSTSTKHNPL